MLIGHFQNISFSFANSTADHFDPPVPYSLKSPVVVRFGHINIKSTTFFSKAYRLILFNDFRSSCLPIFYIAIRKRWYLLAPISRFTLSIINLLSFYFLSRSNPFAFMYDKEIIPSLTSWLYYIRMDNLFSIIKLRASLHSEVGTDANRQQKKESVWFSSPVHFV